MDWGRDTFGVTINEFYGQVSRRLHPLQSFQSLLNVDACGLAFAQTESNLVLGNCASLVPVLPGSMGRPIPGHDVQIVDDDGKRVFTRFPAPLAPR